MIETCKAYVPGPSLCRNGFPQTAVCRGQTCCGCGQHSTEAPMCQREDMTPAAFAAWFDEAGRPKLMGKLEASNG